MNWKEFRAWMLFVVPPVVAVAVAYGVMTTKLETIEKQQDRNTALIIKLLQK